MNSLARIASQLRRDLKVDCRFECAVPVLIEDNAMAPHLYRIAQEAVNNALRHGKAEQVVIELKQLPDDQLLLRVEDNGVGVVNGHGEVARGRAKGLGLRSMAYRAGLLHGSFHFSPRQKGGVEVTCVVPYKATL